MVVRSVLIETSVGELTIDLFEETPLAAKNFLKLCKIKYYNNCLFFNVQRDFIAQCGDPTATGKGGSSVYGYVTSHSHTRRFSTAGWPSCSAAALPAAGPSL